MNGEVNIKDLWSLKLNPSDLYNIERPQDVNPPSGGGHTYIQIPAELVAPTLRFLDVDYPAEGEPVSITVHDPSQPSSKPEQIEFWDKSGARMRIAQQNRHRHTRLSAWSPQRGFPHLDTNVTTDAARYLLRKIGQLHIYLVRDEGNKIWAGFTTGTASGQEALLPFANILWGSYRGGYWAYEKKIYL